MSQTTTSVFKSDGGYYDVRIPKALGDALDLESGDRVEWKLQTGRSLEMRKV